MRSIVTGPGPLQVAAGTTSDALPFPELASQAAVPTIFLRLVQHGPARPAPTFTLSTDLGAPVVLTGDFQSVTAADGTVLADAATAADPDGSYRIRILTQQLGTHWSLTIANNDAVAHTYLGVVADDLDETRQPWIDVAAGLAFRTVLGRPQTLPLRVGNLGTGDLRVTPPTGAESTFALGAVPPRIGPNDAADLTMTFTPASTGSTATDYTIASNDLDAGGPGHGRAVHITTVTTRFARGTILVRQDGAAGPAIIAVDPGAAAARLVMRGQVLVGRSQLMVEADGHLLLVPDDGSASLVRIDPGAEAEQPLRFQPPVAPARSAALAPDGTVVAATGAEGTIVRLDPATGMSRVLLTGTDSFTRDHAVGVGGDGTVYDLAGTDSGPTLFRIDAAGSQRHPIANDGLSGARAIAVDAAGNVLVTLLFQTGGGGIEVSVGEVKRVDVRTGEVSQVAWSGLMDPRAVAVEGDGHLLVADAGSSPAVLRIDPATGQSDPLPAAPDAPGVPRDVAVVRVSGGVA